MTEPRSPVPETITVHELVERSATAGLEFQREDGSFPPGHNTVYEDRETPVRSTSHWLAILSKAYEITGEDRFLEAAADAADYLLLEVNRPGGHTFLARESDDRDQCNGLVGQSAPIKGLVRGARVLDRDDLLATATDVFSLHPFDPELGLWERVEVDGTVISFDRTLNHQALFAARATPLAKESPHVKEEISSFLDALPRNMELHEDGVIKHYIRPPPSQTLSAATNARRHWRLLWNELVYHYHSRSSDRRKKEVSYQAVNLSAWAALKRHSPDHPTWDTRPVEKALSYVESEEFVQEYRDNDSRFASMNPGMGIARALIAFDRDRNLASEWLAYDIYSVFDFETDLYSRNAPDPMFRAASLSGILDLPNVELERTDRAP